jgi:DNA repair exonuclease SbcCD ATPase subunit
LLSISETENRYRGMANEHASLKKSVASLEKLKYDQEQKMARAQMEIIGLKNQMKDLETLKDDIEAKMKTALGKCFMFIVYFMLLKRLVSTLGPQFLQKSEECRSLSGKLEEKTSECKMQKGKLRSAERTIQERDSEIKRLIGVK